MAVITESSLSESEVASVVTEDIENLKPSVMMQTIKELSPYFFAFVYNLLVVIITLFISSRIIKLISNMFDKFLKKVKIELTVRKFLISTFKILLYALVVLGLAERMGVNQASLVAILGSAGVAVGLAWQGSLSNFAGGMIILFSRPFVKDDYIITPKGEGSVDTIGIIYTVLITPDNKRISIPNGTLANDVITNVTANDVRRIDITVEVSHSCDIRKAKKLIREVLTQNGLILKNHEIISYVSDLASSSVILGGRAWSRTEDYWPARWAVIEEIKVVFDKNNIEIPFEQMDVHIK
jgi:small-conductance mechanosensitive channel